ncbi:MAG: serine/threonine-protein phosphatase [Microthrixaceae bacterium]|nr:serine/threonine-protein phosphatase [Microthrixaceae bacterium]
MTDAQQASAPIVVSAGSATDVGLRRRINEDSMLARHPMFLVADGMGGHEAGEVASAAALAVFEPLVGLPSVRVEDVVGAIDLARQNVDALAGGAGGGAGTTLTGVVVSQHGGDGYWLVVNLGDSRTYRLAGGALEQISVDHSVVQELVDAGEMTAEEAATAAGRNVITRALGAGSDEDADFWLLPAAQGDRMLVCSDGLSGEVDAATIHEILASVLDPQAAAERLVLQALANGGRDNVTAVVVDAIAVAQHDPMDTLPRAGERDAGAAFDDELDADTVPRKTPRSKPERGERP